MVFKRYFEQRFLDGLQRKAQAYPCKMALSQVENLGAFQFCKKRNIAMKFCFSSPVSPARACDIVTSLASWMIKRLDCKLQDTCLFYY